MSSSAHNIRGAVKTPVLAANAKIRFPTPGRPSTAVDANQLTLGVDAKNAVKGADDAAFATLADARNAADRRNAMSQPVVGAQEGLAEALALKIGDRIIAAITKTLSSMMEELRMAAGPCPGNGRRHRICWPRRIQHSQALPGRRAQQGRHRGNSRRLLGRDRRHGQEQQHSRPP